MASQNPKPTARNFKDLEGKRFGRWTVIAFIEMKNEKSQWLCRCDCGNEKVVANSGLISGRSQSCGCLHKETVAKMSRRPNSLKKKYPREYAAWNQAIQRCTNQKLRNYEDYGGRGITVCNKWRESFQAFIDHIGPKPSDKHSLDRIDNDKGYEPGNVRWSTDSQQISNSRHARKFEWDGELRTIKQLSEISRIPYATLQSRLVVLGWELERAMTTPQTAYHNRKAS